MKFGEFKGTVASITVSISAERPAVFTRIVTGPNEHVTHAVRLNSPDSTRIGFDELRGAFPKELAGLTDEELLTVLIEKTDTFVNRPIEVGVEAQMKNGIAQKSPAGVPYFNVRLRSAIKNLDTASAKDLASKLLAGHTASRAVDEAFAEQLS